MNLRLTKVVFYRFRQLLIQKACAYWQISTSSTLYNITQCTAHIIQYPLCSFSMLSAYQLIFVCLFLVSNLNAQCVLNLPCFLILMISLLTPTLPTCTANRSQYAAMLHN